MFNQLGLTRGTSFDVELFLQRTSYTFQTRWGLFASLKVSDLAIVVLQNKTAEVKVREPRSCINTK